MDLQVSHLELDLPDIEHGLGVDLPMDLPAVDIHSTVDPVNASAQLLSELYPFRYDIYSSPSKYKVL